MGVGRTILDHAAWKRDTRQAVAARADYRCQSCGKFLGMNGEADHIVPRAKCAERGISEWDTANLQWLCPSCHSRKTNGERWDGKRREGPKPIKRTNVPGRKLMLAAAGVIERRGPP